METWILKYILASPNLFLSFWRELHNTRWCQLKYCFNVHPENWGNDPIWLAHVFQMGWFNHQLVFMRYYELWRYLQSTHPVLDILQTCTKKKQQEKLNVSASFNPLAPLKKFCEEKNCVFFAKEIFGQSWLIPSWALLLMRSTVIGTKSEIKLLSFQLEPWTTS